MTTKAKSPFFAGIKRFVMFTGSEKITITNPLLLGKDYIMHLTEEQITQFQTLYQKHFGLEISRERAYEEGIKLVRLMQLIYKPIKKEGCQKLLSHRYQYRQRNVQKRDAS